MRYPEHDGAEEYEATKAHLMRENPMGVEAKAEHTPGPWTTWRHDRSVVVKGDGGPVFEIAQVVDHADARLIAAAPELLEALRPFARFACDPPCEGPCHNCEARAAIEKAEGTNQ